jgi:hypothetical protein
VQALVAAIRRAIDRVNAKSRKVCSASERAPPTSRPSLAGATRAAFKLKHDRAEAPLSLDSSIW